MIYINNPTTILYYKIVFLSTFSFFGIDNIELETSRFIGKAANLYISIMNCESFFFE